MVPLDKMDVEEFRKSVNFYVVGFGGLPSQSNSLVVADYRPKIERMLNEISAKLGEALKDDTGLFVNCSGYFKSCVSRLHTLDKNLAFKRKPQWSWDEVIAAMSVLETVKDSGKLALMNRGIDVF